MRYSVFVIILILTPPSIIHCLFGVRSRYSVARLVTMCQLRTFPCPVSSAAHTRPLTDLMASTVAFLVLDEMAYP